MAEDRKLFKEAMERIGVGVCPSGLAETMDEARDIASNTLGLVSHDYSPGSRYRGVVGYGSAALPDNQGKCNFEKPSPAPGWTDSPVYPVFWLSKSLTRAGRGSNWR